MSNIILGVIAPISKLSMTVEVIDGGFDISINRPILLSPNLDDPDLLEEEILNYKIFIGANDINSKPDICSGYITKNDEIKLIWDSERMSCGDIDAKLARELSIVDINRSNFSIGFGKTGNFFVASVSLKSPPVGDAIFEEMDGQESTRDWISSKDEELSHFIKNYRETRANF